MFIASARLTFAASKDFISFSVGTTSGSGVRCAKAEVAAHRTSSERIVAFRTESLLLQVAPLALKAGPKCGRAPVAIQILKKHRGLRGDDNRPIMATVCGDGVHAVALGKM